MSWCMLDDGSYDHPKVVAVGNEAWGAFLRAIAYCNRHANDGAVTHALMQMLLGDAEKATQVIHALEAVRLLDRAGDAWVVHDFADYNLTAKEAKAKRKATLKRVRAHRSRNAARNGVTNADVTACVPRGVVRSGEERSLVVLKGNTGGSAEGGFDAFWALYPKKVGKAEAQKAWGKVRPTPDLESRIRATLGWQVRSPRWLEEGGRYVPNPATWLNQGRWDDEPTNVRYVAPRTMQNAQVAADWLGKS